MSGSHGIITIRGDQVGEATEQAFAGDFNASMAEEEDNLEPAGQKRKVAVEGTTETHPAEDGTALAYFPEELLVGPSKKKKAALLPGADGHQEGGPTSRRLWGYRHHWSQPRSRTGRGSHRLTPGQRGYVRMDNVQYDRGASGGHRAPPSGLS